MADAKLTALDAATTIDRSSDYLYGVIGGTSLKISPNVMLGISGDPVGTSDTQTLTNKTLTAPVVSTISNTGVLTLPTSTDTLVGRATTDTLTNKTLTAPTINNPTLATNTVSEFTATNGVTVDGLNIKDGKLNTNDSVVTTNITDANVTTAKLADNAVTAVLLNYNETSDLHSPSSLTASTWFNVKDNQNFTVSGGTNSIINVSIYGSCSIGTSASNCYARVTIDSAGTPITRLYGIGSSVAGTYISGVLSSSFNITGLSAGVHTIKLDIMSTVDNSLYIRPSSVPNQESLGISIVEHKK